MRDFPRPKKITVNIFGEPHDLKRLSFYFLQENVPQFFGRLYESGAVVTPAKIMEACVPAAQVLLETSFPTFKEWEDLPIDHAMGLMEVIVESNDVPAIIENFSKKLRAGVEALSPTS